MAAYVGEASLIASCSMISVRIDAVMLGEPEWREERNDDFTDVIASCSLIPVRIDALMLGEPEWRKVE